MKCLERKAKALRKLMQLLQSISFGVAAGSRDREGIFFTERDDYSLQFSTSRKSHLRRRHFRYPSFNAARINCLKASGYVPLRTEM